MISDLMTGMRASSATRVFFGAVLLAALCDAWRPASAKLASPVAPPKAVPAKPGGGSFPRPASCHNGMSFDRFLADLKHQAAAAGVSQRAIAEASPYLVYDQGIVN